MGAWEEIVDYTVPSNTTSVVLNNFGTITKDDFIKIVFSHQNPIAATNLQVFANSSISSNYTIQVLRAFGSSVNAQRFSGSFFNETSASKESTTFMYFKLSENDRANFFCNTNVENDSAISKFLHYFTSSGATFNNGVASLTFSGVSNAIGANSRIQIYRLAAEKVADITVTSNTTRVDITGLNITKDSEYLLVSDINNNTSSGGGFNLYVNNNISSSNYFSQRIRGASSDLNADRYSDAMMTRMAGNLRGIVYTHIKLSNIGAYTSQNYSLIHYGTSSLEIGNYFISSTAENITSITQLNIQREGSTTIGANSRFQLYKLY